MDRQVDFDSGCLGATVVSREHINQMSAQSRGAGGVTRPFGYTPIALTLLNGLLGSATQRSSQPTPMECLVSAKQWATKMTINLLGFW